jgi:hypothetical protein
MNEASAMQDNQFLPVTAWPLPRKVDCMFYHSVDLPDGDTIDGVWDIRGGFEQYIGHYPLAGKTVFDVGTAGGFLAFSAEQAGATVTATDARDARDIRTIQFHDVPFHQDRAAWISYYDPFLVNVKNAFWFTWHKLQSEVEVVYLPIEAYPFWNRRFDVVIVGALVEHLSDPVMAISNIAALANEAVIIAFTPVEDSDEQIMRTANDWSNSTYCYTWWTLSRGLYERIFNNLGFSVEYTTATARTGHGEHVGTYERPTIIARRVKPN